MAGFAAIIVDGESVFTNVGACDVGTLVRLARPLSPFDTRAVGGTAVRICLPILTTHRVLNHRAHTALRFAVAVKARGVANRDFGGRHHGHPIAFGLTVLFFGGT